MTPPITDPMRYPLLRPMKTYDIFGNSTERCFWRARRVGPTTAIERPFNQSRIDLFIVMIIIIMNAFIAFFTHTVKVPQRFTTTQRNEKETNSLVTKISLE